jgi:non-heme chloroperoxidase
MSHITTRDDTKLYVKDWGSGRPVILIHGWPLSADTWDDVAIAIADAGLRAIAYDRRGFGRSSQPFSGYDYDTLADDLADVIDESDARDATIVGFSMGGGEVARYMSRHRGQHVVKAALIAAVVPSMQKGPDNPHGVDPSAFDDMAASIAADRAHFFTGFFKTFYGDGLLTHPVSDEVLQWSRHIAMQASLKATLACANAFATTDFREDLDAVRVPTLIIHGTADKTVPIDATARRAAKAIPHPLVLEYDGAPHGLLATDRSRLIPDLLAFLLS